MDKIMHHYRIVTADLVADYLNRGWVLHGSPIQARASGKFYQAMTYYGEFDERL